MTIIYTIILFVFLIFPHELGHFLMAKLVGIKVNEFAFGMGPALFKKQGKETLYSIRLVPIGGYCAMEGEKEESDNSRAFNNKPAWAKLAVLFAGSAMNVLIVLLVFSIMMGYAGTATTSVEKINEGSPAFEAGIQKGDKVLSINGTKIDSWQDMTEIVGKSANPLSIEIQRDGNKKTIETVPEKAKDGRYVIGVLPEVEHNVFIAVKNGAAATWNLTGTMFTALKQLVTGEADASNLAGPVGLVSMVSETSNYGLWYFGSLIGLLSMNLAIINLLPLPALDGGRIIFVLARKLFGGRISDEFEGKVHTVGIFLLFALMIFVTWNDIVRLFS